MKNKQFSYFGVNGTLIISHGELLRLSNNLRDCVVYTYFEQTTATVRTKNSNLKYVVTVFLNPGQTHSVSVLMAVII